MFDFGSDKSSFRKRLSRITLYSYLVRFPVGCLFCVLINFLFIFFADIARANIFAGLWRWTVLGLLGISLFPEEIYWRELSSGELSIPKTIHQTYKSRDLPSAWAHVPDTYAQRLPGWEYVFWSDESGRQLIADEYEWFLPEFDAYQHNIERADAVRYFILHRFGGVYVDMDIMAERADLENLIRGHQNLIGITPDIGLTNAFMAAEKGSSFMRHTINVLTRNAKHRYFTRHFTILMQTGPMLISMSHAEFMHNEEKITIVSPKTWGKCSKCDPCEYGEDSEAFFHHLEGSSWFKYDTSLIIKILCHWKTFTAFFVIAISSCITYYKCVVSNRGRRKHSKEVDVYEMASFLHTATLPHSPSKHSGEDMENDSNPNHVLFLQAIFYSAMYVTSWIFILKTFDGIQLPR